MLPHTFKPDWLIAGLSPRAIETILRVDRELALERFLRDHFIPLLKERGYTSRNLLQALGSWVFDFESEAAAHNIWDALAKLNEQKL